MLKFLTILKVGLKAIARNKMRSVLTALGQGRLAVAETASVPAGRYAKQALEKLKLWPALSAHVAQADNVRAALEYVARSEASLKVGRFFTGNYQRGISTDGALVRRQTRWIWCRPKISASRDDRILPAPIC